MRTTKNSQDEFVQMMEDHSRILFKIAGAYARTTHEREDLIGEIVLQLWRTWGRFQGNCKLSTWVYRVALNTAMNQKRKRKNETLFGASGFVEIESFKRLIDAEPSEELELLYQSIDQLDDLNKAIILLYLDGHSHDEMADIIGMSRSNIGTRICRIKDQLRKMVNSKIE